MPIPTFLLLVATVILAAGITLALVYALGLSLLWFGLAAMVLTLVVRGLAWR